MRIAVVGSGYVGLVTGTCFADLGHDVMLVDNDEQRLSDLGSGDVPIHERFPRGRVRTVRESGLLPVWVFRNVSFFRHRALFFKSDIDHADAGGEYVACWARILAVCNFDHGTRFRNRTGEHCASGGFS